LPTRIAYNASIKADERQDQSNKGNINPEAKLQAVDAEKKQGTMFEMTKLISADLKEYVQLRITRLLDHHSSRANRCHEMAPIRLQRLHRLKSWAVP
jgi:hypothetical protein